MDKVYIGYSNDSNIRYHSSSGGIVTAIIKYLFETKYIGTFLSCAFNETACCYEPKLIYSYDEYELVGSVYQDMDIVAFFKSHISNVRGRLMVVCSPCLVKVIRHIAKTHSIDVFIASYFCSGQTKIEGTYFYYKAIGIEKSNVVNIRYRGDGWPNGIAIQMKDGSIIKRANYTEPWKTMHQSRLFTPRRCFKCKQLESTSSDISVGDPWLKEYIDQDKTGNSLFIVHSELGLNVIEKLKSERLIICNQVDYNLYEASQKFTIQRKSRINEDKELINFELKLQSLKIYYDWATKNYTNMKKHVWIISHLVQPYFRAKKMNSKMIMTKLFDKVKRKINNGKK